MRFSPPFIGRIRCCRAMLLAVAVVALAATGVAAGHPKPSPVPTSWELDFEPGPLRLYVDRATGDAYWYFTYTVTNDTGADRIWAPELVLLTDEGEILESGDGVPVEITEDIMDLLGNDLLEQQNQIIGDIFVGEENARDGIVVWPARDLTVNELSLFISGISGETARVQHPITGESYVLRKTLQRDYLIPGNASAKVGKAIDLVDQRWILR